MTTTRKIGEMLLTVTGYKSVLGNWLGMNFGPFSGFRVPSIGCVASAVNVESLKFGTSISHQKEKKKYKCTAKTSTSL